MKEITAYYDRQEGSIQGLFTIQEVSGGKIDKKIDRVAARSGQASHVNTSWTRGKSPIPYGQYWLWLDKVLQPGQPAGATGIGEFRNISSELENRRLIKHPTNSKLYRMDIGLHPENDFPGSVGCIVVVKQSDFKAISSYLNALLAGGLNRIRLVVL